MKSMTELAGGESRLPQRPHKWERLEEEQVNDQHNITGPEQHSLIHAVIYLVVNTVPKLRRKQFMDEQTDTKMYDSRPG